MPLQNSNGNVLIEGALNTGIFDRTCRLPWKR